MSSIITTEELATYTGETLDTNRAAQVVAAVNSYVESATGRCWGETKTVTETHDYASVVFLANLDVTEVTKVERGQGTGTRTTLDADSYFVNAYGRLVLNNGRSGFAPYRDYIHVTYQHGVATVPADLKQSALALAADYYSYATDGNKEASAESIGSYKLEYSRGGDSTSGSNLARTFDRYRVRRV